MSKNDKQQLWWLRRSNRPWFCRVGVALQCMRKVVAGLLYDCGICICCDHVSCIWLFLHTLEDNRCCGGANWQYSPLYDPGSRRTDLERLSPCPTGCREDGWTLAEWSTSLPGGKLSILRQNWFGDKVMIGLWQVYDRFIRCLWYTS